MKAVGILGGMGPEATALIYQKIVKLTDAEKDQDHIRALIYSNSQIPNRVEAILSNRVAEVTEHLQESAKILERSGADFIVIACNTAHFWIEEIRSAVDIPVLDMVEETALFLAHQPDQIRKVGLIGSPGMIVADIYPKKFSRFGIEVAYPSPPMQDLSNEIITRLKSGNSFADLKNKSESLISWFKNQNVEKVILGCTELPILFNSADPYFIDPVEIISRMSIRLAGGRLKDSAA